MYEYKGCGLENIFLKNGYTVQETEYGEAVSIHNVEQLHQLIGLHLVMNKPQLTKGEVRFLRIGLDLAQSDLGAMLGVGETTVRNWESGRGKIPGPADRLLRTLYREHAEGDGTIRELIKRVGQLNRDEYQNHLELVENQDTWAVVA